MLRVVNRHSLLSTLGVSRSGAAPGGLLYRRLLSTAAPPPPPSEPQNIKFPYTAQPKWPAFSDVTGKQKNEVVDAMIAHGDEYLKIHELRTTEFDEKKGWKSPASQSAYLKMAERGFAHIQVRTAYVHCKIRQKSEITDRIKTVCVVLIGRVGYIVSDSR